MQEAAFMKEISRVHSECAIGKNALLPKKKKTDREKQSMSWAESKEAGQARI